MIQFSNFHKGILCAIFSAIFFGLPAYFGLRILKIGDFSIVNMLFWRFFVTMLVFGSILIFKKQLFLWDKREGAYALGISSLFGLSSNLVNGNEIMHHKEVENWRVMTLQKMPRF